MQNEESNKYDLKPCPFCGGKAMFHSDVYFVPEHDAKGLDTDVNIKISPAWISCINCGAASGSFENKEKAVAAWNNRVVV